MANIPNAVAALASAVVSDWSKDEDDWSDTTELDSSRLNQNVTGQLMTYNTTTASSLWVHFI